VRAGVLLTGLRECAYVHVALLIQHAARMRHVVTSVVATRSPLYFSTLSNKRCDLRERIIAHEMCFDFLYKFYIKHFSFKDKFNEIWSRMSKRLHIKYPLFLSNFSETWAFLGRFFKKSSSIKFYKTSSSGNRVVPCGQTDRETEMTKLIVAFGNFINAPKKDTIFPKLVPEIEFIFTLCV
jgi:hypothetical protein